MINGYQILINEKIIILDNSLKEFNITNSVVYVADK